MVYFQRITRFKVRMNNLRTPSAVRSAVLALLLAAAASFAVTTVASDISLQTLADSLPDSNAIVHRVYIARVSMPEIAPARPPKYPPLDVVKVEVINSAHNAKMGDYEPPQHPVPQNHPYAPTKKQTIPFDSPSELEVKVLVEQLRPGSLSRSEIQKHPHPAEGPEFLVEGSRVWVGSKGWVVREWQRGKRRFHEDDWNLANPDLDKAEKAGELLTSDDKPGEERSLSAVGVSLGPLELYSVDLSDQVFFRLSARPLYERPDGLVSTKRICPHYRPWTIGRAETSTRCFRKCWSVQTFGFKGCCGDEAVTDQRTFP